MTPQIEDVAIVLAKAAYQSWVDLDISGPAENEPSLLDFRLGFFRDLFTRLDDEESSGQIALAFMSPENGRPFHMVIVNGRAFAELHDCPEPSSLGHLNLHYRYFPKE